MPQWLRQTLLLLLVVEQFLWLQQILLLLKHPRLLQQLLLRLLQLHRIARLLARPCLLL
jgi:hypothetical protein